MACPLWPGARSAATADRRAAHARSEPGSGCRSSASPAAAALADAAAPLTVIWPQKSLVGSGCAGSARQAPRPALAKASSTPSPPPLKRAVAAPGSAAASPRFWRSALARQRRTQSERDTPEGCPLPATSSSAPVRGAPGALRNGGAPSNGSPPSCQAKEAPSDPRKARAGSMPAPYGRNLLAMDVASSSLRLPDRMAAAAVPATSVDMATRALAASSLPS
mmetsp:Transcript_3468/g.14291  ORF Transcript_3468/g.14291 Transcript_3468/m.14291 type:complete len:221 (-) Transcript_3468:429-1091(-)